MVRAYSDMIYGVAMRYVRNPSDAEEVYSDVFYRYFRRQRTFDSEEHRKAWLLRVTVNASKEYLSNRRYNADLSDDMFGDAVISGSWDTSAEDCIAVRDALKRLDEKYREVIDLYYFSGLKVGEIARMLQKPENTVKSLLSRGREQLKEMLS